MDKKELRKRPGKGVVGDNSGNRQNAVMKQARGCTPQFKFCKEQHITLSTVEVTYMIPQKNRWIIELLI